MVLAPVAARELVAMSGIASGELFAWNVRQWLGQKTKVNREVELTGCGKRIISDSIIM
jgi:hypothetical protein